MGHIAVLLHLAVLGFGVNLPVRHALSCYGTLRYLLGRLAGEENRTRSTWFS